MPTTKNVIVFVVKDAKVMILQEKRGTWGLPGGRVDTLPTGQLERSWDAIRREFQEEVGAAMPMLSFPGERDFGRFVWEDQHGKTGIYVGTTKDDLEAVVRRFKPNREIQALRLVTRAELVQIMPHVRNCARGSFTALLNEASVQSFF
jgi:8-oxo-dGTP pyrophosphatase MutT (NUDIX family)